MKLSIKIPNYRRLELLVQYCKTRQLVTIHLNARLAIVAQKIPGISNAQRYWYDTEVVFKNQYEERLNEIKNTIRTNQGRITRPGEKVWSGKPIRQGVERATRWAREESEAQGNVLSGDAVGSDQVNKSKKLAIDGSVTPGQPRQESFINPSLRLANGQVTLNPLEFMPNYRRGEKKSTEVHSPDTWGVRSRQSNT